MYFSKLALLSFVVVASAAPNALPKAEAVAVATADSGKALEARTFWNWWNPPVQQPASCNCYCPTRKLKRSEESPIDKRTFWWLWPQQPAPQQDCTAICKSQCDSGYQKQCDNCITEAGTKKTNCENSCGYKKRTDQPPSYGGGNGGNNGGSDGSGYGGNGGKDQCRKQCATDYNAGVTYCKQKYLQQY